MTGPIARITFKITIAIASEGAPDTEGSASGHHVTLWNKGNPPRDGEAIAAAILGIDREFRGGADSVLARTVLAMNKRKALPKALVEAATDMLEKLEN